MGDDTERSPKASWHDASLELDERRQLAIGQGGPAAVTKQHARGRLTIRERIARVLDDGTFREVGPIAGSAETSADGSLSFQPANFVLGTGKIFGRHCVVGGEDFTIGGGSPNPAGQRKSVYTEDLALQLRLPLVRLQEGAGASVTGTGGKGAATLPDPVFSSNRFESIARCLQTVPVASAALGAVAGLPAGRFVASHFTVMTSDGAQVMTGGPALVERALGLKITKEELGGADVHAKSGLVDQVVPDEDAAFDAIRTFLSYLPQNVWEAPPAHQCSEQLERDAEQFKALLPTDRRHAYDMRKIINAIVDRDSFFEIGRQYGRGQVVGLARLAGQPVGIFANDTKHLAGSLTADGAQKVRRFVDLCGTFHLPVITLVDEPGFMIGPDAEKQATIRHGAAALTSVALSPVPWAAVLVRRSMGLANYAHIPTGALVVAWPSAESGALPVEGGVAIAFRREIAAASDPTAKRAELEAQFAARQSPFRRAEAFGVHDLIHPHETRTRLSEWLDLVQPKVRSQLGPAPFAYRP
jgi:methylmalonyl-CoA decarboxylase subunit alpha